MDQEKIQKMQFLEQNLQSILMQRQAFQMELNENIAALKEIKESKEDVYKIIGQLMIKISKEKIEKELNEKEKLIETRLKTLETQEEKLGEETNKLREEIMGSIEKNEQTVKK